MSSPTLIDDSNPAVQYSHNWTWVPNLVPEVDHTRHGVSEAGQTASLAFTGTGIQVFGTLEPSDVAGQPTTQYTIDGTVVANYTAPFTASGASVLNVTFFSKLDLSADGDHELVITNMNGTSPNMFWLDFFLVYTSTSQNPTGSASGVPAVTATPSSTSGTGSKTISVKTAGGIIGGIAGGLVLVIILLVVYIVRLKRRHKRAARLVQPYNPPSPDGTAVAVSPRRKAGSPPILPSPTVSESAGPSSAAMSAIGPVVPISASRVNVASSTGALSETGASVNTVYPSENASESMTDSGGGLLVRPPHREGPVPARSPEEVLSLAQSLLHAVAQGQGPRRQDEGQRDLGPPAPPVVATDSGLRLYNEGMLPPSYSSA
ncbi:hypothetical protein GSI_12398 [Ganoderma sinense ZZ0214-1]|uniref:Transmembrane protein n=1 Tax=Ganoderma sinense ZZ0214-1 TaxID=1077348 RepID=A0A2G8RVJ0_9APHY|nr:hypothetical protein GSI_12398 [Ganoderma sinense ZZ0214-1]